MKIIPIVFYIILVSCQEKHPKSIPANHPIMTHADTTPVVSPVKKLTPTGAMPSYCKTSAYTIAVTPTGQFIIFLPGGTMLDGVYYRSANEAQRVINEAAAESYKRWVKSGGVDF